MKICFLMDNIHYLGGAQRCTVRLANELTKKGHQVSILYTNKDNKNNYSEYNLNKHVKLEYVKLTDFILKVLFCWVKIFEKINSKTELLKNQEKLLKFIYYGRNIFGIKRLQRKLDTEHYDCVIGVGAIYTIFLTLLNKKNTKFIGWQHTTGARYFETKNFLLWHQDCVFKNALSYLDKYVVLTTDDAKYIKDRFGVNVDVIYNPTSFETDIKNYNETKTILAVGRYHKVKGFDLLIDAFKVFAEKNKDWKLRIIGEGEERSDLQSRIDSYNLQDRVFLAGKTDNIINEYKNSDFFVLSSRIEGFGIVVIEAMECGLPVVSFELPSVTEILTKDDGILVKCFDIEKLAEAMEVLSTNAEIRKIMGENCKKRAKDFCVEKIVETWESLIK